MKLNIEKDYYNDSFDGGGGDDDDDGDDGDDGDDDDDIHHDDEHYDYDDDILSTMTTINSRVGQLMLIWAGQSWSGQLIFFYFAKPLLYAKNRPPPPLHPKLWLKV